MILACACALDSTASAADERPAFKGYELYSWQEPSGAWKYALLEGTNRLKSGEEIHAAAVSEAELRGRLPRLAAGEIVTWCTPAELDMEPPLKNPPQPVVESLLSLARDHRIELRLCQPKHQ